MREPKKSIGRRDLQGFCRPIRLLLKRADQSSCVRVRVMDGKHVRLYADRERGLHPYKVSASQDPVKVEKTLTKWLDEAEGECHG